MNLRLPRPLRSGDTVAVTAPSSGLDTDAQRVRLDLVLDDVRARGFQVREGRCLRLNRQHVSAPARERSAELMQMLLDPSVHAIVPPWGGELAIEVLDRLDWARLREAPPKWVLGYSDTSTLLMALTLHAGWATAHGPSLMDLVPTQSDPLTRGVWPALGGNLSNQPLVQHSSAAHQIDWTPFETRVDAPFNLNAPTRWWRLDGHTEPLRLSGRLIGGCLDTVCWLAATPYGDVPGLIRQSGADGVLLYLENAEMAPCALLRCLWSLRHLGWFDGLHGLVVGRSAVEPVTDPDALNHTTAWRQALAGLDLPVLMDADIGHRPPQMLWINGAHAELNFADGGASLVQRWLAPPNALKSTSEGSPP